MNRKDDGTSLTLLERVRAQQPDAWDRFVELYAPLVQYWCRRSDLSAEDTADVFQEVFRSVAQSIERFRYDRSTDTFRGWLRTIAQNKIRDHYRRQRDRASAAGGTVAQVQLADVPAPDLDEDDSELQIVQQSVRRALDWIRGDFEPRTWDAFWQSQIDELPTDEIARALEMTPAAVRKAKYRVLRRLREEMEGLLE